MSFHAFLLFDDAPDNPLEIVRCRYWMQQSIDDKGQPSSRMRGGTFTMLLRGHHRSVTEWLASNTMQKSGRIRFLRKDQETIQDEWVFENAYGVAACYKFSDRRGQHMLVGVSAERFTSHGITHDNRWSA